MKKRLLTIITALVMIATCFAPVTGVAFAASDTNSDGTYAGTMPSLPNGIEAKAIEFSWAYGTSTSKYKYPSGTAVDAFKTGIDKAYPNRSSWSAAPKVGASCDVFVGVVARNAYDTSYPRGLDEQFTYLPKSSKFTKVADKSTYKSSVLKPGDILIYSKKAGGAHTTIYVTLNGAGYLAEAHYQKYFPSLYRKLPSFDMSDYNKFEVYRATGTCNGAIAKGQYSTNVKYLQAFLNWAGFSCGTPDGAFGSQTETALKNFQKAVGLTADGKCGSQTLAKAKTYKKGQTSSSSTNASNSSSANTVTKSTTTVKTVTKKGYTGKFPTSTVNKRKGSKTNIKRWQNFLKWYGYPITTGGTFGSKTIKYTKAFQKANGLKADGSAGPKTIKKAKQIKK